MRTAPPGEALEQFRRFLDNALGSLAEVPYLLRFSREYGLLNPEAWLAAESLRNQAGRLTWRLYTAVAREAAKASRA